MKTAHELKRFFKENFGITVKANTGTAKSKWQHVYISCDHTEALHGKLTYSSQPFPEDFRKLCIKVVYPTSESLQSQSSVGNITAYGISLVASQWETVISEWNNNKPKA